jgi:hypothetical protein
VRTYACARVPMVPFLLLVEGLNVCLGIHSIFEDTADSRIPALS